MGTSPLLTAFLQASGDETESGDRHGAATSPENLQDTFVPAASLGCTQETCRVQTYAWWVQVAPELAALLSKVWTFPSSLSVNKRKRNPADITERTPVEYSGFCQT